MRATPPIPTVTFSAAQLAGEAPETSTASRTTTATIRRGTMCMTSSLSSRAPHFGIAFQYENRASRRLRATSMAMTAAIRTSSPASTPVALNIDSA